MTSGGTWWLDRGAFSAPFRCHARPGRRQPCSTGAASAETWRKRPLTGKYSQLQEIQDQMQSLLSFTIKSFILFPVFPAFDSLPKTLSDHPMLEPPHAYMHFYPPRAVGEYRKYSRSLPAGSKALKLRALLQQSPSVFEIAQIQERVLDGPMDSPHHNVRQEALRPFRGCHRPTPGTCGQVRLARHVRPRPSLRTSESLRISRSAIGQ